MPCASAILTFFLMFTYCSAVKIKKSPSQSLDDKKNWLALLNVLKSNGSTNSDATARTVFDKIILANAQDRATAPRDDGLFLYQGDITMSKRQAKQFLGSHRLKRAAVRHFKGNRWKRNSLVYHLHPSLNVPARRAIRAAIAEWQRVLPCLGRWRNIKYLRKKPKAYIQFYGGNGCTSPVGRLGGLQRISIGNGCESKVIAVHEIGHAMGMWHEQSRPDRDRYVKILWNNILPGWKSAFRKIASNVVNSMGISYDYESVMHYPTDAFAKHTGLQTIKSRFGYRQLGNTKGLSPKDIQQVQRMYGCVKEIDRKGCSDVSHNCMRWKDSGYCKYGSPYRNYMKRKCCKACKEACMTKDESETCPDWSKDGYCEHPVFSTFIRSYCRKSCHC